MTSSSLPMRMSRTFGKIHRTLGVYQLGDRGLIAKKSVKKILSFGCELFWNIIIGVLEDILAWWILLVDLSGLIDG